MEIYKIGKEKYYFDGKACNRITVVLIAVILILASISIARAEEPEIYVVKSQTIRYVTAYNVGDEGQTDDTPCIGAANTNLCEALARGEKHCAANFVKLGTKLHIQNVGLCIVTDRMNKRYRNRVDIAMPKEDYKKALTFGCQKLIVRILEEVE